MKRKLALLLAGSMALTAVPAQTIFAANGELFLGNAMQTPDDEDTTQTAVVVIGDGTQTVPAGSGFSFELVNAEFTKSADSGIDDNGDSYYIETVDAEGVSDVNIDSITRVSPVKANVVVKDDAEVTKFNFSYKVKDASKPAYIKCTFSTADDKFEGKQIQLTKVVGEQSITGKVASKGDQVSLGKRTGADVTFSSELSGAWDDADGTELTITLPAGYTFDKLTFPTIAVQGADGGNFTIAGTDGEFNAKGNSYTVTVPSFTDVNNVFGSTVKMSDFTIYNNTDSYNKDVVATFKVDGKTAGTGTIANFNTFAIVAEISEEDENEDVPTIQSGLTGDLNDVNTHKIDMKNGTSDTAVIAAEVGAVDSDENETLTFTVKESIANSYRGGDLIITLPEGVNITGVEVEDIEGNVPGIGTDETTTADASDYDSKATGFSGTAPTVYKNVIAKDNVLTLKDVQSDDVTTAFELEITLEIEADADFDGEVKPVITSGKNAIDVIKAVEVPTIANMESKIAVETKVSEVAVGYTSQPAADIVVSEKEAGVFNEGETFTIALDDAFGGDYSEDYGLADATVKVTAGDAEVDYEVDEDNDVIKVTLENITSDEPIAFTVSDVKVFSNRSVPTYNGSGDVIEVKVYSDEQFDADLAAKAEYIKFVNELSNTNGLYNKDVTVTLGGTQATLADGTKVDLYGAAYIAADGNYMMPVKGAGYALGLTPEDIVYDAEAKMATFFLLDGGIAQIQAGSSYATVNGVKLPLLDAKGNLVTPVIKDGRFYLPLRATAKTVFGVEVDYNEADKSVVLNPSK